MRNVIDFENVHIQWDSGNMSVITMMHMVLQKINAYNKRRSVRSKQIVVIMEAAQFTVHCTALCCSVL